MALVLGFAPQTARLSENRIQEPEFGNPPGVIGLMGGYIAAVYAPQTLASTPTAPSAPLQQK